MSQVQEQVQSQNWQLWEQVFYSMIPYYKSVFLKKDALYFLSVSIKQSILKETLGHCKH